MVSRTAWLRRFCRAEDGTLIILGLFFFVAMLFAASLAIDLARYEQQRVQLQGISDRAVLAGAKMRRDGDGGMSVEDHVAGYFLSEGFTAEQIARMNIAVEPGAGGRGVSVAPNGTFTTLLMSLIDVDDLAVATLAQAAVSAPAIELVLVLDISWSMTQMTGNGLTRIENLRQAAAGMITDLMADRNEGDVAITIVPYESWVVPPPELMNFMTNVSGEATTALGVPQYCMEFDDWDDLATADTNPEGVNPLRNSLAARVDRRHCGPMYGHRVIRPFLTSESAAISVVNALQPMGSTSIDLGLRMGAMFFDDDLRPYIGNRITANEISPLMMYRPAGVDDPNVLRVMVVMTDGENCCNLRFAPEVQDRHAQDVCSNLRAANIQVYSVAFEAPENGADLMRACASGDSYFFNTNGAGLGATFQAIGRDITARSLRLTR
jgi:hypothetical protein